MFCATNRAVYLSNDGGCSRDEEPLDRVELGANLAGIRLHEQTSRHASCVNHIGSIVWLFELGTRTVEVSY